MTQATDIPEYGQFIKSQAPPRKDESLGDIVGDAMNTLARQMRALAQSLEPQPDEDRVAQIESVQEDMRRVRAEFADPRGHAARLPMLCELLRLCRVCTLARCRKSDRCRGGGRCLHAVDVPEPVFARVCWLLLAARLPWIASGRTNERVAYEAWVAAMDARMPVYNPMSGTGGID